MAAGLLDLGVSPGESVALMLPTSRDCFGAPSSVVTLDCVQRRFASPF
jgi:hypothetical protein